MGAGDVSECRLLSKGIPGSPFGICVSRNDRHLCVRAENEVMVDPGGTNV